MKPVKKQVRDQVVNQVWRRPRPLASPYDAGSAEVYFQVRSQVWNQVLDQIEKQVLRQVWRKVLDKARTEP